MRAFAIASCAIRNRIARSSDGGSNDERVLDLERRVLVPSVGAQRGDEALPVERGRPELEQQVPQPLDR